MTPKNFKQANRILKGPDGSDIQDLPSYTDGQQCISCWALTWRERLTLLLTGRVWLYVMSGHTQPPVCVSAEEPVWSEPTRLNQAEADVRNLVRAALKRARKAAK